MTKYTRDQINKILMTNDAAVERAIIVLFNRQTADEQSTAHTKNQNSIGFSACDAKAGTRFARFLLGMNDRNQVRYRKKNLSHPTSERIFSQYCRQGESPIDRARRIAIKHSRQLVNEANNKAG
jgi:hypothetical protein